MARGIDIDHLRQWIGREERAEEALTAALVQRFSATFDRTPASDLDEAAPPLIHLCLAQPTAATAALADDGHPMRGGFLPPVPLPRRMWAGGEFWFDGPIRMGQTVTRRSVIRDVTLKEGRSGALCFVTIEHELSSSGASVVRERQDIVYRAAAAPEAGAARLPDPAPPARHSRLITAAPPLLLRYSALTFNAHRIHYDRPYATAVEGYPGLVVHGPLQATLLCHFATDLHGSPPRWFRFRSVSALHDDRDFTLNAEPCDRGPGDRGLRLWTATPGGPVAMEAWAAW